MDDAISKSPIPWPREYPEVSNLSKTSLNVSKKTASTSFNASLSKTPNELNVTGKCIATQETPGKIPKKMPGKVYIYMCS
ncbi:hypothetical protein L798_04875 [Zootermopsis nevadensis]|uniref:Uncharacterized protein n=1 Tax=Zootermopsis nevadensis TaxID=136037 RepID=A0A067QQ41_ZOONE|nr:hypothetical protein L798_04875 [Zootermopsis nevadensis]